MNIKVYQINLRRDDKHIAFMGSNEFPRFTGSSELDSSILCRRISKGMMTDERIRCNDH